MCGWMIHSKDGSEMKSGLHPPLVMEKARYVGDPIAVVIADTKEIARTTAENVEVEYEELEVITLRNFDKKGTNLHDNAENNLAFDWELGDSNAVKKAAALSAHQIPLTIYNNRLAPNAMETRCLNAYYDERDDRFTLYIASQNPHGLRMTLSAVIGLAPEHKLRVISEDVGGGFGSKAFNYSEEVICAWASKVVGRPVKWTADRNEAFLTDAHGRDQLAQAEMYLDEDKNITGLKVSITANTGCFDPC